MLNTPLLKTLFCCWVLLSADLAGYTQEHFSIAGKVTTLSGLAIPHATITLSGTVTIGTSTDSAGYFAFNKVTPGSYTLTVTSIGYRSHNSSVVVKGDLSNLVLQLTPANDTLKAVTVSASQRLIENVKGKIVVNVEKSVASSGSTAFELLQRTPGISIDANDNILLKGGSGVNIMIDGKMTYMTPQQLSNLLKGMPSDNIARIELMQAPGAEFDAAGNAGIINIITRKSNKPGYALNISSSVGAGHYFLHNENVTGNIRLKKFNFYGTLGYNYRKTLMSRASVNETIGGSDPVVFDRLSMEPYTSKFYTYKAGAEWYIDQHNQLSLGYNGSLDDWSKDASAVAKLYHQNSITGIVNNRSVAIEPYYNNVFNLNYTFKPDTTGKSFSVDGDYIAYRNYSDGYLGNQSFNKDGAATGDYQELRFKQPSFIKIRSVKADVDLPYSFLRIKAGIKYAAIALDNNFRYDSLISNAYVFAPTLSDHFLYDENISAAYVSAERKWRRTTIVAGLRAEHTSVKGTAANTVYTTSRSYTSLFPSLTIEHQFDENQALSLNISRRINRPAYAELNPVKWYADKYSYYTGNPQLRPELSWQFAVTYSVSKYAFTLSYNRLNNFISQTVITDNTTGVVARQNANFSHQDRADLLIIVPVQPASFWSINATAGVSYTAYPIAQSTGFKTVDRIAGECRINQVFSLPAGITAELNAFYHTGELNGIFSTRNYFMLDGGLKKSFLSKKLDLKISFTDALHTNRFQGTSLSDLSIYQYRYIPDSRRVFLTAVYRLGGKVNSGKNRITEEQQRL